MLPRAVLFDLNDTILDDSGCVERSWTDACEECCPKDEMSRIREAIRVAAKWFWADPDRHRSLALVTNGSQRTQRMKISRFNLEPLFDAIFVEGELGFGKPDLRVFQLALDRLQRSPSEVCR